MHFNKNLIISVKDEENFNQVIIVGYIVNYLLKKMKK